MQTHTCGHTRSFPTQKRDVIERSPFRPAANALSEHRPSTTLAEHTSARAHDGGDAEDWMKGELLIGRNNTGELS